MTDLLTYTQVLLSGPDATDFGVSDTKGRRIGYEVTLWSRTYAPHTGEQGWGWGVGGIHQSGATVYRASTTVLKDGKKWGATSDDLFATTLEEVRALVAKRMAKARSRYAGA
jgi:hypothetical protein